MGTVVSWFSYEAKLPKRYRIWGMGNDDHGQIGPEGKPFTYPVIAAVAAGVDHTLAILTDGQVSSWGCNLFGQLGNGLINSDEQREAKTLPCRLVILDPTLPVRIMRISAGFGHSAAVSDSGRLFTWGLGSEGQLGYECTVADSYVIPFLKERCQLVPKRVEAMEPDQVEDVACGKNFTLILTVQKTIFACGSGRWGVLGNGKVSIQHIPTRITEGIPQFCVTKIACGWSHCLAAAHGKGVYMWGQPYYDCDDDQPMIPIPQLVLDLNASSQVTSLSCGQNHSAALVHDPMNRSQLFTWGSNAFSQLGYSTASFPDPSLSLIPRVVEVLSECDVLEVTCGWNYTAALVREGRVIGWGGNKYYQFGEDKFEERPEYLNLPRVDDIVSGYSYIFMLTRDIESKDLSLDRELGRIKTGSIEELYVDNSVASKKPALFELDPH